MRTKSHLRVFCFEVVADGCEMMLRDTHAPEILARENPTLLRKICDWLGDWVKKIKAAFGGVDARHEEAKILLRNAEQLQARFDKALAEAVQNRETMRGENETTAEDGGRVQYSIETLEDGRKFVKADRQVLTGSDPEVWAEQLTRYINKNIRMGRDVPLNTEDGNVLLLTSTTAEKAAFRNIETDRDGKARAYTDEEYRAKLNAEAHIDELARTSRDTNPGKPNISDENSTHGKMANKGWRYREAFFMDFDGKYYRLTISVAEGEKGKVVYNVAKMRERTVPTLRGSSSQKTGAQGRNNSFSGKRVSQNDSDVKVQKSERDNSVSDRELLREAAEHEGASEELKRYAKKADNLEAYQRRLERQEAKLKSKELSSEERAALEKRAAETKALIARTQTALHHQRAHLGRRKIKE